ncbi:MAG: serine/threonine-protein kinase [Polyangiales bacterium]
MSETARTMLDRYELIAPIARGGMGSVHLARLAGAGGFQRLYAIKRMHPHLADEEEFVAMLLDEARLAARIHHTNAVAIIDVREHPEGPFVVMDYVDGVTLARLTAGAASLPWRARTRLALRVICDALAGLHAAHDLHDDDGHALALVHRDVSPQNILVGTDGVGRITDFGIAVAAARIAASRPGTLKGKPAYMSPEQVSGETIDRRSDLFAMGVVLWECLTGQRLFQGGTEAAALVMVLGAPIASPREHAPEVGEALAAVCLKALARPREERYADAREMLRALETAAAAEGLLASTHEVSDALSSLFAEELQARRAMLRDAARAKGLGSLTPAFGVTAGRSDSKSIPAIEVLSRPLGVDAVRPAEVAPPTPPPRRWIAPAAAATVIALSLAGWALRRSPEPAPAPTPPTPRQVFAAPAPPAPEPARAPPPAPAPPAPVVTDAALAVVDVAPTPTPRAAPTPTPRAARVVRPAPSSPPLETNPYLRP